MSSWKRQAHLWHRWLGIALGLLVLLWFGSGIVMMYVPYPALTEQERMVWLAPLKAQQVRLSAWDAWQTAARPGVPEEVRLTAVAGRAAYQFKAGGHWLSVWADDGEAMQVTPVLASASAVSAAPGATALAAELIDIDQWSFGSLQDHRPLYRVSANDAAGSVLYVSSRTGELVRDTTRSERAWNWAGSVIHWIYFTPLRTHGQPWRQVVMWTSGAALLLVMLGMVLGLQRLRLRRRYAGGRCSPYRGWRAWHHWLGLGMGTLMITWLFSGWLSVTPFNWLASPGVTARDRLAFAGGPLDRADLSLPAAQILRRHPGTLELVWRRVDGQLYLSALDRAQRRLLDASGKVVPSIPAERLLHAIQAVRPGTPLQAADLLTSEDNYYYSHHRQATLPVLRAQFQLADETTFYIDAAQGRIADYADRNSKWNRWLFNGLHQLDFAAMLRARPLWDVLVIVLCVTGALSALTGVVLGWRRLKKSVT
ncbi:PepSY domain-containing protein [Pseudoduganella sp. FT26W]|uniref:PepSY domain-containing protein n=1 Tax=Duganella aquatilis TaxID=2666082 RepID=A0A844D8T2_9BURK|nr:PepSY domain-containing protein [Duganella aquatilis]MRW83344.1 PepSY domain-containing protein [Duganella aquatilis]